VNYQVRQTTDYTYAIPVPFAQHVLRVTPVDRPGQTVWSSELEIEPPPAHCEQGVDFFGNCIVRVDLEMAHDRLSIRSTARVHVEPPFPLLPELSPAWEDVRSEAAASADLGGLSPVHYLFATRLVPLSDAITAYAAASFPPRRSILAASIDLMQRIHGDFAYRPGTTDVTTPPDVAFVQRRGVCQDFAHIMIAGLRGLGLPAGYVSGYVRTVPFGNQPRLEGADASHAWVMIWCGAAAGWRGLDPTNGLLVAEDHIVVAIGRDYADVAPVDGVIIASGDHDLNTAVDVFPLRAEDSR
jgi:transglutaminase-like putative cysteine protease